MRKPKLSFGQIFNMSFGFLGIQFGFALQNANVSRIFETLGAKIDDIPILWIAAPATGLIIQPIIGYLSDRTWGKLGRRRPYFLIGAILSTIALFIMPNSPVLWVAAGMLWILDASINISMEPFRALVADNLPSEQRTTGFAVQSFFIGVGAVVASALPYIFTNWLHIPNTAETGKIPPAVMYSFYFGGLVLLSTVLWTIFTTKEYPPEDIAQFEKEKQQTRGLLTGIVEIGKSLTTLPKTMVQLAVVQFFTWFALFSMWIYTTSAITHHIYHATDAKSEAFNKGADWVGVLFALYSLVAAFAAFLIPIIANNTSRKITHSICLLMGAFGLGSIYFINNPDYLILSMVGVGIAWASILSMPYAILAGSLPVKKMGFYMGIFNFFIVIPQIIASGVLGFLMRKLFNNDAIYAILLGAISLVIAAVATLWVTDNDDKIIGR